MLATEALAGNDSRPGGAATMKPAGLPASSAAAGRDIEVLDVTLKIPA
jgi:hypothetical protein